MFLDYSIRDNELKKMSSFLIEKREEQIIGLLKKQYPEYDFDNKLLLITFIKTKCTIQKRYDSNIKTLVVDGKPLCVWDDTIDVKIIIEPNTGINRIIATLGTL